VKPDVLISVAHSQVSPGAVASHVPLTEYMVSLRASLAALRHLCGIYPVEFFDCGPLAQKEYAQAKIDKVNACRPALAVEIHCNASDNHRANYSEVIHHPNSQNGALAGEHVALALDGILSPEWKRKGARPNTIAADGHTMFFLHQTHVPCIIVEGVFISNLEQAAWLSTGGAELYGIAVADGIKNYLDTLR
jgi:hypothetical protein